MDIFMPLAICVICIIIFTLCGWCCKRKREGTVYGYGPSVTVTTTSTTQPVQSPLVVPPYPVDPRHPTPQTNAPGPGFTTHQAPYPMHNTNMPLPTTAPCPYGPVPPPVGMMGYPSYYNASGAYHPGPMTYPLAGPYPQSTNTTPYPPGPTGDYNAHPPPYDVAVATPPNQPHPTKEGYAKQAPYNPSYN